MSQSRQWKRDPRRNFSFRPRVEVLEDRLTPSLTVPEYSSRPGAPATIYLDFDGHFDAAWGSYANVTTPAYDIDGIATDFSDGELSNIYQIFQYVAEDYAPFNINVTTVLPSSFANGVAERVAIGGNGSWTGGNYGGISYVNSFTSSIVNTAYVFPANLGNGYAKYVGDACSHEAGHAFGLTHQSQYSGSSLVATYYSGLSDGTAPLMGNSYGAARSMWWYGTSSSSSTLQDDMAIISSSTNGFGYRLDDYGNTSGSASPLSVAGNGTFSVNGVIERMSDLDTFSFSTAGGAVTLSVAVPAPYNNLDARIEVRDSAGNLVASEDSGASDNATVSFTAAPGTYYVTVASHGVSPSATANNYGQSVGQFTLSGTIVPGQPSGPAAPSNLAASAASSTQVNLTWTDNAADEDGFKIERYDNGVWTQVATVGANVTSWQDAGRAASTTYTYRVRAYNASGDSAFSNTASATTPAAPQVPSAPAAPSGLTGSAKTKPSVRINLTWVDNANNETGYQVYRSTDGGVTWTLLTQLGANATSYSDSAVTSGSYRYRVLAYNAIGTSAFSNEVTVSIGITSGKGNHGAALGDASDDLTPAYQGGPSDNASQTAWLNALRYWLDKDAELNGNVVM